MQLMLRHHEVDLYRRWSLENGVDGQHGPNPPELAGALARAFVSDPLDISALRAATVLLQEQENAMREIRDVWIVRYLSSK